MQTATRKTVVDVDTRRAVIVVARGRKPAEVAKVPHESFIRNMLKERMGWPRREPAPETIKEAARQMAAALKAEEKARYDALVAKEATKTVA